VIRWTTTRQASVANGVKILGYGGAGVGKTSLCATMPEPWVILSAEAGMLSLRRFDIAVAEIHTLSELSEVYRWLSTSQEARQIVSVSLDSVTEIGETLLTTLKASNKDPRKAYGEMLDQMLPWVRAFRDLPGKHVYMSAKEEWAKDEASGIMRFQPMMPGQKLGPQLPYLFDEVFHVGVGRGPDGTKFHYLQTQADLQYVAKDRSGSLAQFEPMNLSQVIQKIGG